MRPLFLRTMSCFLAIAAAWFFPVRAAAEDKPLTVYFIDVEGGQATLFVTPEGKSLLIDTGWPDNNGRDADRIVAAAKQAGLTQIDFVLLTHYHMDHAGGVPQLLVRIAVGAFIDHGPNREPDDANTEKVWEAYQSELATRHIKRIVAKPGDVLPVEGIKVEVLTADGASIDKPLPGAGAPNPSCATSGVRPADPSENARSLGTLLTFGKVRILDLGDLTWQKERDLVCPDNKIGHIDVFIVSHHGSESSDSPALLQAITPRISIMDNGAKKGGAPSSWDSVRAATNLDFWQVHYAEAGGSQHNSPDSLIANVVGRDDGKYLKLSVWPDGALEVYNARTQASKHYPVPRP